MPDIEYSNYKKSFEQLCRDMKKDILQRKCMSEEEAHAELRKILIEKLNKELGGIN